MNMQGKLSQRRSIKGPAHQRGAVALMVSAIILVLITVITLYTSRSVQMETRISANDVRKQQAMNAADAGFDRVLAMGTANLFDCDSLPLTENLQGGASYRVSFGGACAPGSAVPVVSEGWSDDRGAYHRIAQTLNFAPVVANQPEQPIISHGACNVTGSLTVINNVYNTTIWSGRDVEITGASANTQISVAGHTYVVSTDREFQGVDVIENDYNLKNLTNDEFFQNFFGRTKGEMQAMADITDIADLASADANGKVIWISGSGTPKDTSVDVSFAGSTFGGDGVLGSSTDPVVLIVDGDIKFTSSTQLYGVLYVTGHVEAAGGVNVYGSVVVEGDFNMGAGNFTVEYHQATMDNVKKMGEYTAAAGGWRDWQ